VLVACAETPRYGYEIAAWLTAERLVTGPVSPGRLYETLGALARHEAITAVDEPGDKGPARRRYHLTETGRARLKAWAASLDRSGAVLGRLLARMAALDGAVPDPTGRQAGHDIVKGGEPMPCQCHCGGPADRSTEARPAPASAPEPAPARSVEERLDTIESLLKTLSTR
jgi:DNA-binding PadR family transcriptional regulator